MSRMRFLPQRIDDQTFHAGNLLYDFVRDCAAITEIGYEITIASGEEISAHFGVAMRNRQRSKLRFSQKKRAANNMRFRSQIPGSWVRCFKGKLKNALQIRHCLG